MSFRMAPRDMSGRNDDEPYGERETSQAGPEQAMTLN